MHFKDIKILPLQSVNNPSSIHGIYPYRGKISALDAVEITKQLKPGKNLLDPFCGSGTIVLEAYKKGLNSFGVDSNPLAIWLAQGKAALINIKPDTIIEEVAHIIQAAKKRKKVDSMESWARSLFHDKTTKEIMRIVPYFDKMSPYTKAAFLGSIALTARGCNQYKWTSSTVGKNITPKKYINFYEKFTYKANKHLLKIEKANGNKCKVINTDSKKLSSKIKPNSIHYVFTSPPYFDGLDYTAYYGKIIYSILGFDRGEIKETLIQNIKTYEEGMRRVFDELLKVTTDDALIIFVVGDKKVRNEVINGGEYFSKLLHHDPNIILEREYTNSSSQIFDKLNKTKRKEQVVVWDKKTWK